MREDARLVEREDLQDERSTVGRLHRQRSALTADQATDHLEPELLRDELLRSRHPGTLRTRDERLHLLPKDLELAYLVGDRPDEDPFDAGAREGGQLLDEQRAVRSAAARATRPRAGERSARRARA